MNPHQRLSWTLALSLFIWTPIALNVLGGHIEVTRGGLLYLAALGFAWVGTGVIERIVNNYRETQNSLYRAKLQIERLERRNQRNAEAAEQKRRSGEANN